MASRPAVIPEAFTGDGEWTKTRPQSMSGMTRRNYTRLTGRAQLALQHLPEETRDSYVGIKQVM